MGDKIISIEVSAATPERQIVIPLRVREGTTLIEAIEQSGLAERMPDLEIDPRRLGIFGRRRPAEAVVENGDRVEVYRPLSADPKEVRRELAELEKRRRNR